MLLGELADLDVVDEHEGLLNQCLTLLSGLRRRIVHEILLERHDGVRSAACVDLARFTDTHEAVTGASCPIAGCAEAGNVAHVDEPGNDLIERPRIVGLKLRCVLVGFGIATHRRAGAAADLRDTQVEGFGAHCGRLPCRDNHSRVRHGQPDAGNDMQQV